MNIVALVGHVASDPEVRETSGGRAVCTFRLAISRVGKDAGADFLTVVAWEKQALVCKEYVRTGRRVAVDGRLHHSTWEVEGQKRSKVEVVAHRVELLGRPRTDVSSEIEPALSEENTADIVASRDAELTFV